MKYIQSYTEYEYEIICGEKIFLIPKKSYSEMEMQAGKRNILPIEDSDIGIFQKNKIVKCLLNKKKNGIRILDNLPQKYRLHSDIIKEKENEVKDIRTRYQEVVKENEELKKELEQLKKKNNKEK